MEEERGSFCEVELKVKMAVMMRKAGPDLAQVLLLSACLHLRYIHILPHTLFTFTLTHR